MDPHEDLPFGNGDDSKADLRALVQQKAFTRWLNKNLGDLGKVEKYPDDLLDGVLLIKLVEKLSGKKVGKYHTNCKLRIHMLENLEILLKFLKEKEGMHLINVGAADIAGKNTKIIGGLFWKTISKFQLEKQESLAHHHRLPGDEEKSAKAWLLEWVHEQLLMYSVPTVKNFTTSWSDGQALCALVDSLQPGVVNFKALSGLKAIELCEKALDTAEKQLGIGRILDAEDFVEAPDEHSVITYISDFHEYARKRASQPKSEALKESEKSRLLEVISDAIEVEEVQLEALDNIVDEAKSLGDAIDLCQYLEDNGKSFEEVVDIPSALKEAKVQKIETQKEMKAELTHAKHKVINAEVITNADVERLYQKGQAGPRTGAHLRTLRWEGKKFDSFEQLGDAVKATHQEWVTKKKKDKRSICEYLSSDASGVFAQPQKLSTNQVNGLFQVERSGRGTSALVQELQLEGKTFDNFDSFLAEAKQYSTLKRNELRAHLARASIFVKPTQIEEQDLKRLVEESEAGPQTLERVEELELAGIKVEEIDEVIPLVREIQKKQLDPILGPAIIAKESKQEVKIAPEQKEEFLEFVENDAIEVFENETLANDFLQEALTRGESLGGAIDLCSHLKATSAKITKIPDITPAFQNAAVHRVGTRKEVKALLTHPDSKLLATKKVSLADVDLLYKEGGAGAKTPAHIRWIASKDDTKLELRELAAKVKQEQEVSLQAIRDGRAAVLSYLLQPDCPLWKHPQDEITPRDVSLLFAVEGSAAGTVELISQLIEKGEKFDSMTQLLQSATTHSKEAKKNLSSYLTDRKSKIWKQPILAVSGKDLDRLVEEGRAGPSTLDRIKEIEDSGLQFSSVTELIPPLRQHQEAKPNRLLSVSYEDLESLMDYFASPECKLLDRAEHVHEHDLHELWRVCPNAGSSRAYCVYLNRHGHIYDSVQKLTRALKDIRSGVKSLWRLLHDNPHMLPTIPRVTIKDAEKIYFDSPSDPTAQVQAYLQQNLTFGSIGELIEQLGRDLRDKQLNADIEALLDLFASKDFKLLDDADDVSEAAVADLFKIATRHDIECVCRILNAGEKKFASLHALGEAIGDYLNEIDKLIPSMLEYLEAKKLATERPPKGVKVPVDELKSLHLSLVDLRKLCLETEGLETQAGLEMLVRYGRRFYSFDELLQGVKTYFARTKAQASSPKSQSPSQS